jgi:CheY-specific phosphatase CheX
MIDREILEEALHRQQETIIPLGVLAIETSYLNREQVAAIEETQRSIDKMLGEIAVERRWLGIDQLQQLLQTQQERRTLLGELLVRMGHLSKEDLDRAVDEYKRLESRHAKELEAKLSLHPACEILRCFIELTAKHYLRSTCESPKLVSVAYNERLITEGEDDLALQFVSQEISGDVDFTYGLLFNTTMLLALASSMLHSPQTEIDDLVKDVAAEFTNMVAGNCLARLSKHGLRLRPQPPKVFLAVDHPCAQAGCTRVELFTRRGSFNIVFVFADDGSGEVSS